MEPLSTDPVPPREALKRHLITLVVSIVVLDAIAIPVFYLLHFNQTPGQRQNTYIGVWMVASALVVAVQLRKIRRARMALMGRGKKTG